MGESYFTEFGTVLLFFLGGAIFISLVLGVAALIRPDRPNTEKLSTYECGEEPSGSAWGKFNIRFYVIALIFILFDVEIVFLFPWATIFAQEKLMETYTGAWTWFTLSEMFTFILILVFGLVYAWKKGMLEWEKPVQETRLPDPAKAVARYSHINEKYKNHQVKQVNRI